jgi:hypothetical protein
MKVEPERADFFESYVDKTPDHWLWWGSLSGSGYPRMPLEPGKEVRASRVSLALAGVPVPDGHEVSPTCGVRTCVNPQHLEVVDADVRRRRPRPGGRRARLQKAAV